MVAALRHRGPDDEGIWADERQGIALGHRRLSIIDLSPAGHQPMLSPSGRFVLTYNGEIYNHVELRDSLERRGVRFRGSSDTEVLAAGLDVWGLQGTVTRSDGMFAFGVWDRRNRSLSLVRDRFGEKPLYWGWDRGRLLFGSELRALAAVSCGLQVDARAVADVVAHKCVQGTRTILEGFHKVPPAHILTTDGRSAPEPRCYWSATEVALDAMSRPLDIDEDEAASELTQHLERTVASRMVADVPVGVFLSGGIDSAGIVAFMVATSSLPVRTFTVGLDDDRFDESEVARSVAARLGTDHHPLRVRPAEVVDLVADLADVYDEPFGDSSQLPTLMVSALAVEDVKVALTGDGGDEIFGGYNRHVFGDRLTSICRVLPSRFRHLLGARLERAGQTELEAWFQRLSPWLPPRLRVRLPADKAHKLARVLRADDPAGVYEVLRTDAAADELLRWSSSGLRPAAPTWHAGNGVSFRQWAMLTDTLTYLPDDILVKVDRAAMSVSLETRAPYLDHHLFEWSWRLPSQLTVGAGIGKRILRRVVQDRVGGFRHPQVKSGFGIPVGTWLRGPLRPWAEDLLTPLFAERGDGMFRGDRLRRLWTDHVTGRSDNTDVLWNVLMLSSWLASRGLSRDLRSLAGSVAGG